jgi:glycosyltransferase involved in cell wall biosynthesis
MLRNISILIPCYRVDNFLIESLQSINDSAQTLDIECVMVANNMNIHEIEKLRDICEDHLAIPYRLLDAGVTDLVGALNYGLYRIDNEYVARMDQDDIMMPERLIRQIEFLESNNDISLVGSATEVIDSNGQVLGIQKFPSSPKEIRENLPFGNSISHPTIMFRKDDILRIGGYNPLFSQAEDYALYIELCNAGFNLANLPEPLLQYRVGDQQVSNKSRAAQISTTRAIIVLQWFRIFKLRDFSPIPQLASDFPGWLLEIERQSRYAIRGGVFDWRQKILARRSLAYSYFAIAKSCSIKNSRDWSSTRLYLGKAFLFSPNSVSKLLIKHVFLSLRVKINFYLSSK